MRRRSAPPCTSPASAPSPTSRCSRSRPRPGERTLPLPIRSRPGTPVLSLTSSSSSLGACAPAPKPSGRSLFGIACAKVVPRAGGRPRRTMSRSRAVAEDGVEYRDLNGNGRLDPYEDPRLSPEERVADLLPQLSLEEKAGMLFHPTIGVTAPGEH